jgi:hypothetical protein
VQDPEELAHFIGARRTGGLQVRTGAKRPSRSRQDDGADVSVLGDRRDRLRESLDEIRAQGVPRRGSVERERRDGVYVLDEKNGLGHGRRSP